MSTQRGAFVAAISKAATFAEQQAAVAALDLFDRNQAQAAQTSRDLDWADTTITATLSPVLVHERSGLATDWLGEASTGVRGIDVQGALAEAAMWFSRTSEEVKSDREEFTAQARGFMHREASRYGEDMDSVYSQGLTYLGFLWTQSASGLDQIQQTVNPHEDPKTTPLDPEVFDTFGDEVHPLNAGVVGTETSERNPLLQEIEQEGSGQGQWEVPGGHSTDNSPTGPTPPFPNAVNDTGRLPEPGPTTNLSSVSLAINHIGTLDDFLPGGRLHTQAHDFTEEGREKAKYSLGPDNKLPINTVQDLRNAHTRAHQVTGTSGVEEYLARVDKAMGYPIDCSHKPKTSARGDYCKGCGSISKNCTGDCCDNCTHTSSKEAASGLDQVQQTVNPHEDPKKLPLPLQVAYPWLISDDAYGNEDDEDDDKAKTSARTVAAQDRGPSYNPDIVKTLPLNGNVSNPAYYYTEGYDHGRAGQPNHGYGGRDKAIAYGHGYKHGQVDGGLVEHRKATKTAGNPHPTGTPSWFDWESGKGEGHGPSKGTPSDLFPSGVPLHGELSDEQQQWLKSRGSLSTQADMWGNSDDPHQVAGPSPANTSQTAPQPGASYAQGQSDALAGDRPTYADVSSEAPQNVQQYSHGYADGVKARQGPPQDVPGSLGGDNGQGATARRSDAFTKAASRTDTDFAKGYAFASRWTPGQRLVTTGSAQFESGLYAALVDHPQHVQAWRAAHRRQGRSDEQFARRVAVHDTYTDYLAENGIDVTADLETQAAKNTSFGTRDACSKCGQDIEYVGHRPDPDKEFLKIDRGAGWWDRGGNFSCSAGGTHERGRTAATSTDLDTSGPNVSPSPTGQTPINGPGTTPPLEGQDDPAASGGPAPYNGAPPYGTPAVPLNGTAPSGNPRAQTINDVPGGPVDGNARPLAFRRMVQAGLLAKNRQHSERADRS